MSNLSTSDLLIQTIIIIGLELCIIAAILIKRRLFHWLSVGFWSWSAFSLYFIISPLSALLSGKLEDYYKRALLGGGSEHILWIIFVISTGILIFYVVYFRTPGKVAYLNSSIRTSNRSPFFLLWMMIFIGFGIYALLASRAGLASWSGEATIVGGRFTGDVTGYQNAGYMFMVYPTILLCLLPRRNYRVLGLCLAIIFIILSIPHAVSRYATVSMAIAVILVWLVRKKRIWPPIFLIIALILFAFLYQARGHVTWKLSNLPADLGETWKEVENKGISALAESDTQMLPTFWVESYLADRWIGYNYGMPLINYFVSGWIPGRIFPDKYFLIDWLASIRSEYSSYPVVFDQILYGSKSTLIGSFYQTGGLLAVVIEMALLGWLGRRMDGMLSQRSSPVVQAMGICWLSTLWMVWASSDTWGLMALGVQAIPYIAGIILFFKVPRRMNIRPNTKIVHI